MLELAHEIAGPYAGKLLADQDACVLKVEAPGAPDPLRTRVAKRGVALAPGEDGALFRFLNAGKRAALCDSASASERAKLVALAREADIIFTSGAPGELAQRAESAEALRAHNPRLAIVNISPWGAAGPCAARPATEWTLQAATGFMARRGTPARGPVGVSGRIGEYAAGAFAAVLALAAVRGARASGRGRTIDLSLFEAMLICTTQYWDLNAQFLGGALSQYVDTPSIEPCKGGWVGFATTTAQQWKDFCLMIERPELAEDERLRDANARMAHLGFVRGAIRAWTSARTSAEILELCELMRIPCAPVLSGEVLLQADHFRARRVFVKNPHGFMQPRTPFRLGENAHAEIAPAPSLGEHELAWPEQATREQTPTHASAARTNNKPPQTNSQASAESSSPAVVGDTNDEPLADLRVVDLTAFWAGPFATQVLAMLGADVVKLEATSRPDGMRFVNAHPDAPLWEGGSIFHGANSGKRGITLRLDHEAGRALLRRMVERADVLIENFSVRVLGNFGLDVQTLLRWNPRLIVLRMPAWGLTGPWCARTGFAMNVEQASGIAHRAGYPDQPLVAGICDPLGSLHAVTALLAALETRRATGRGLLVEAPLVETALNIAAEALVEATAYPTASAGAGDGATTKAGDSNDDNSATTKAGRSPDCAPQGIYPCAHGSHLALAVASDAQWRALCRVFAGERGAFASAALASAPERHARHEELDRALIQAFAHERAHVLAEKLRAAGVPAEALINGHHLMPNAQLEARGFYKTLEHAHTGRARYPGLPCTGLADAHPRRAPPTLGENNREVLGGELGLSDAELEELHQAGVIGTRPAWETK